MLTAVSKLVFDAADRGDEPASPLADDASLQGSASAPSPSRPTAVLILGMHRSGTSLLSSLVEALGISLGDRLIQGDMHNPAGYFEDRDCVDIHDRMLAALGQPWNGEKGMLPFPAGWWRDPAMQPLVAELEAWIDTRPSSGEQVWALKDPRTTRFLPLWQELLQKRGITPRYLLAVRDPAEVVASVVRRDSVPAECVYRTWLRYNMEALLHAGPDLAGVFVYSDWFSDGIAQLQRLAAILGVSADEDDCDAILGRLVRGELRRQHDCAVPPPVWASHLYARLRSLSDHRPIYNVPGLAAEAEYCDALLRQGEDPGTEGALTAVLPTANGLPETLKLAERLRAEGARVVLGVGEEPPDTTACGVAVVVRQTGGPTVIGGPQTRATYALWRWLQQRQYAAVHIEGGDGLAVHCLDARRQGLPDENGPIHVHYLAPPAWLQEDGRLHLHSFAEAEAFCLERRIIANGGCRLLAPPTLLAMLRHVAADEPKRSSSPMPSRGEPLVSVCITHHNRPVMLTDCLASVRAQTYRRLEVILVDDGSTQPAARIFVDSLEEEFQAKGWTLIRQENRYLGAARNAAIRAAKGDYLFILDDDNLLMPDGVERAVRVAQHTNADIVTAVMAVFHGAAGTDPTWPDFLQVFPGGAPLLGLFENNLGDANALVRRSCLMELGGFTEDRGVGAEDWEFYAKAVLAGYRLEHSLLPLSWYRLSDTGMARSGNWWSDYRRALRAYETVMPPALRELPALAGVLRRHGNEAEERSQRLTAELAQRGAEAERLAAVVGETRTELAAVGAERDARQADLVETRAERDARQAELAEARTELAQRGERIAATEAAAAALQAEVQNLHGLVASRDHEIGRITAEITALRNSTSWRLSAPVRVVGRRIKSLPVVAPTIAKLLRRLATSRLLDKRRQREVGKVIAKSGLFDRGYYLSNYADVAAARADPLRHYVAYGAAERRNPSPLFDTAYYLEANPDVAQAGVNPLLHYVQWGKAEGRRGCLPERADPQHPAAGDFGSQQEHPQVTPASNSETTAVVPAIAEPNLSPGRLRNAGRHLRQAIERRGVVGLARRAPYYLRKRHHYAALLRRSPFSSDANLFAAAAPVSCDVRLHPDLGRTDEVIDSTISVVIPTFNAGNEFAMLLRKLKAQRGLRGIEIVIVDSGSRDETVAVARAAGCSIIEIPSKEFSHSYARNRGAEIATGDYLLFTVQDAYPTGDYWAYGMLRYLLDYENQNLAAVSCSEYSRSDSDIISDFMIDTHYRFLGCHETDRIGEYGNRDDHISLHSAGQLSDLACLIPRRLFNDYRYRGDYGEDLDLGIRLIKDGYRVAILSSIKVIHSHNRTPYYHLKRSFVDVIFLAERFADLTTPPVKSAVGLVAAITSVRTYLSEWLAGYTLERSEGVLHEELEHWISEWQQRFSRLRSASGSSIGDFQFDAFIDSLAERLPPESDDERVVQQENDKFVEQFMARLSQFSAFVKPIYLEQDLYIRRQLLDAVCKTFGDSVGASLGFLYLDRRRNGGEHAELVEALAGEMKSGV